MKAGLYTLVLGLGFSMHAAQASAELIEQKIFYSAPTTSMSEQTLEFDLYNGPPSALRTVSIRFEAEIGMNLVATSRGISPNLFVQGFVQGVTTQIFDPGLGVPEFQFAHDAESPLVIIPPGMTHDFKYFADLEKDLFVVREPAALQAWIGSGVGQLTVSTTGTFLVDFGNGQVEVIAEPRSLGMIRIIYILDGPVCPEDLNGDGAVNALDLTVLLAAWGPNSGHPADLNGDGMVSVFDLLLLLDAWGQC